MRAAKSRERVADSLKNLLKKTIKKLRPGARLTQEEMTAIWKGAAGDVAGKHTQPISFRKATLIVNVDDSGWLYELTTRKKEILGKLEGKLGEKKLKDIRFRIGEIE